MPRPTFQQACNQYVHRYTVDHVPNWARRRPVDDDGTETRFYAPHYRSDLEWYECTVFPGEAAHFGDKDHCISLNQSWPLGQWLNHPFNN